jgi:putative NADH-flavin reductase
MRIAVLAASGSTGHQLAAQALDRGHSVLALARDPRKVNLPRSADLTVATADVLRDDMAGLLADADAVVSGIGLRKGDPAGTLIAGARALAAAAPARLIWLGALGAGASASKAGPAYRAMMALFVGSERAEKEQADDVVLFAGATVFHAGPLTDGPISPTRRTVTLTEFKRPALMPARVSRATVAAAMLDEAEKSQHPGEIVVPLP